MRRLPIRRAVAAAVVVAVAGVVTCLWWPDVQDEPLGIDEGVIYRRLTLNSHPYLVAEVDLTRATLRQYWRAADGARYGSFGNVRLALEARGERLAFATNGGIFDPSHTPTGLFVADGVEQTPLNLADGTGNYYLKPNGVFLVASDGAAIVDSAAYALAHRSPELVLQSGPLLVDGGRIHPGFDRHSDNRRVRNAVGVSGRWRVVFVLSEQPVTFFDLASLFRDRLRCPNALYLDGEISRAYAPAAGRHDLAGDFAGILAVTGKQRRGR